MTCTLRTSPDHQPGTYLDVAIDVAASGLNRARLEAAFLPCRQGTCAAPLPECRRLAGIDLVADGDEIHVLLRAGPGQVLDPQPIERCVQATLRRARRVAGEREYGR